MSRPDVLIGELVERCAELESALTDVVLTPAERWQEAQVRAQATLERVQARGLGAIDSTRRTGSWEADDREAALAELGRLVRALDRTHVLDSSLFDAWQAARRVWGRLIGGAL